MDWKGSLNLGQSDVLGLDIGSSSVKMVHLCKANSGYAVTAAGIADIAASDNNDRRQINTVKAIHDCLGLMEIETNLVVCSVCGPEVAVRDFNFPSLPPKEIEGAILLEATQVCPFDTQAGVVDYQLISDDDKTKGFLVAATNAVIKSKTKLAEESSLKCVLMDVDGLALLNCFNGCERIKTDQATAILNVGRTFTNLAIVSNNGSPFVRDMSYAGDDIVKQIASENDMSIADISKVLFGDSKAEQLELHDSLDEACKKLIADVTKTLRYYTAQEKISLSEKILVCGGFALAKGFIELLNSRLPIEAVLWNPFEKIVCKTGQDHRGTLQKNILQKHGPAMAVAAGLAMRPI